MSKKTICNKCKYIRGVVNSLCASPKIQYTEKRYGVLDGKLRFVYYKDFNNRECVASSLAECIDINNGNCSFYKKEKSRVKRVLRKIIRFYPD